MFGEPGISLTRPENSVGVEIIKTFPGNEVRGRSFDFTVRRAGDGIRTRGCQLGKLMSYRGNCRMTTPANNYSLFLYWG